MHTLRIWIVLLGFAAFFPCDLQAQRGYTARTAEYVAATSDLILRGTVSDLKVEKYVPKNSDEERSARNFKTVTVLLNVTLCLKGTTDDSLRFRITEPVTNTRLETWKESKTELFWFFNIAEIDTKGIRRVVPHDDFDLWQSYVEPPDLNAERPPIMLLNVDLEPLTTEKMLEDTIIRYVKRFGNKKIDGTSIPISREIAGRSGMAQAANKVLLPLNYKELQSK